MTIIWRDKLNIGNQIIDKDHKYLIDLFNKIESSLKEDDAFTKLPKLFNNLFKYTQEHFSREEIIQIEINFSKYQEHKLKHQHILDSLKKTQTKLSKLIANDHDHENHKKLMEELHNEIIILAREWVIDHIIDVDRELIPYLEHAAHLQKKKAQKQI